MADHNDPNAVNSHLLRHRRQRRRPLRHVRLPERRPSDGERVVIALTFAVGAGRRASSTPTCSTASRSRPAAAARVRPDRRRRASTRSSSTSTRSRTSTSASCNAAEVRVTVDAGRQGDGAISSSFPGGDFSARSTDQQVDHDAGAGRQRDPASSSAGATTPSSTTCRASSARSTTRRSSTTSRTPGRTLRELKIPKTLLELEGNHLFNFDPEHPAPGPGGEARPARRGRSPGTGDGSTRTPTATTASSTAARMPRPAGTSTRSSCEMPLRYLTHAARAAIASSTRGARAGCSRRRTRSRRSPTTRCGSSTRGRCCDAVRLDDELKRTSSSTPSASRSPTPALNEREDNRQLGANNFWLAPDFVRRLAHLGLGFRAVDRRARPRDVVRPRRLARSRCTGRTRCAAAAFPRAEG